MCAIYNLESTKELRFYAVKVVKVIDQGAFTYYMLMKKKNRTDEI